MSHSLWDKKARWVKGASAEAKTINDALKALEVKIRSAVNQLILLGKPFNVYTVKDQVSGKSKDAYTLKDAFDIYLAMVKSLIGKDYSPMTLVKYKQTYTRIMEFVKLKYNRVTFYLYDLDDNFMSDFEIYLKTEIQNNQTTIYKHWQRLSRVVRYAMKRRMLDVFPFIDFRYSLTQKEGRVPDERRGATNRNC